MAKTREKGSKGTDHLGTGINHSKRKAHDKLCYSENTGKMMSNSGLQVGYSYGGGDDSYYRRMQPATLPPRQRREHYGDPMMRPPERLAPPERVWRPQREPAPEKRPVTEDPVMQEAKFKTKVCIFWLQPSGCPYGDKCLFAHGDHEIRQDVTGTTPGNSPATNAKYKTRMCKHWVQSMGTSCPHGIRCTFAHGPTELSTFTSLAKTEGGPEMSGDDGTDGSLGTTGHMDGTPTSHPDDAHLMDMHGGYMNGSGYSGDSFPQAGGAPGFYQSSGLRHGPMDGPDPVPRDQVYMRGSSYGISSHSGMMAGPSSGLMVQGGLMMGGSRSGTSPIESAPGGPYSAYSRSPGFTPISASAPLPPAMPGMSGEHATAHGGYDPSMHGDMSGFSQMHHLREYHDRVRMMHSSGPPSRGMTVPGLVSTASPLTRATSSTMGVSGHRDAGIMMSAPQLRGPIPGGHHHPGSSLMGGFPVGTWTRGASEPSGGVFGEERGSGPRDLGDLSSSLSHLKMDQTHSMAGRSAPPMDLSALLSASSGMLGMSPASSSGREGFDQGSMSLLPSSLISGLLGSPNSSDQPQPDQWSRKL